MPELRRVATNEDIALVASFAEAIWNQHFTPIIGQAQVDYMLHTMQSADAVATQIGEERYEYDLIVQGTEPVGYTALVGTRGESVQLSKLYLTEAHRGRGLGRAIVARLEERCRKRRARELWLTVNRHNTSAIAFYKRLGFAVIGPLVTDIGGGFVMDDYRMSKPLSPASE